MQKRKQNSETRCMIILCSLLCIGSIGWCVLYFLNHFHGVGANTTDHLSAWYNFTSPIIAMANVIAFIGLTIAIYKGESERQKTHEQVNIQNTIISKLQLIEKDLSPKDVILRKAPDMQDVYSVYITLYKYAHYFKHLPTLSILTTNEKEDAKQVLKKIEEVRELFLSFYREHDKSYSLTEDDKQNLAYQLNYLSAFFEEFEISIIQEIALNVEQPNNLHV